MLKKIFNIFHEVFLANVKKNNDFRGVEDQST